MARKRLLTIRTWSTLSPRAKATFRASGRSVMTHDVQKFILNPGSVRGRRWMAGMVLFAVLLAGLPAVAQLDTGSISGTITDPSGSVVAKAQITATETATGTNYMTVSTKTGYYVFPSVHTGAYQLTIASSGFKTTVSSGITVSIGAATSYDF